MTNARLFVAILTIALAGCGASLEDIKDAELIVVSSGPVWEYDSFRLGYYVHPAERLIPSNYREMFELDVEVTLNGEKITLIGYDKSCPLFHEPPSQSECRLFAGVGDVSVTKVQREMELALVISDGNNQIKYRSIGEHVRIVIPTLSYWDENNSEEIEMEEPFNVSLDREYFIRFGKLPSSPAWWEATLWEVGVGSVSNDYYGNIVFNCVEEKCSFSIREGQRIWKKPTMDFAIRSDNSKNMQHTCEGLIRCDHLKDLHVHSRINLNVID